MNRKRYNAAHEQTADNKHGTKNMTETDETPKRADADIWTCAESISANTVTKRDKMSEICEWTEDDDGSWDAECGGKFVLIDGLPSENSMRYCPYCGKSLHEKRYAEPEAARNAAGPRERVQAR